MKTESFNLNINALDDKVLYKVICKKIKESEAVSFKLLWLIPLVSGLAITGLLSLSGFLYHWLIAVSGLFGAVIIYSLFRWEKGNVQNRRIYKEYAEILEAKKSHLEEQDVAVGASGPFTLLSKSDKPHFWGNSVSEKRWGEFEAVTAIYTVTILFWLITAATGFWIILN